MVQFVSRVKRAVGQLPMSLLLVPMLVSLLQIGKIRVVSEFRGAHVGVKFSFPGLC
jgi:hypothetical protein